MDLATAYKEAGSVSELARRTGKPYWKLRQELMDAGVALTKGYSAPRRAPSVRGPAHHNWKGGRMAHGNGYVLVYAPDHPDAAYKGYIFEHRLVAEALIGRRLTAADFVHHRNGDKTDNRPENLEVMTRSDHIRRHKEHAPRTVEGRFVSSEH